MSHRKAATTLLLLPGLDGTGRLFQSFVRELPGELVPRIHTYPHDQPLGYEELEKRIAGELPAAEPFAIVAESFAGPLAIRIAARAPSGLLGLVLVASFVKLPLRSISARFGAMLGHHLPRICTLKFVLRSMMVGFDVDPELLVEVKAAVKSLPPAVLATRIAQLATVDVTTEFVNCRIPILYLRGTRDRLVSKRIAEQMSRLRPDMRVVSLKAPHLVLQRRPAAATRIVSEFVSRSLQ